MKTKKYTGDAIPYSYADMRKYVCVQQMAFYIYADCCMHQCVCMYALPLKPQQQQTTNNKYSWNLPAGGSKTA
jgi:hypothetical protein